MLGQIVRGSLIVGREALRLILRRPVVGALAIAVDGAGRLVLQRRRDTGTWALPGGFSEWGERIEETLAREIREETGYALREVVRVVGIYSHPRRDPRLHSIAVVVEVGVAIDEDAPPPNPAEVMEVRAFPVEELPRDLGDDTRELIADWRRRAATLLR